MKHLLKLCSTRLYQQHSVPEQYGPGKAAGNRLLPVLLCLVLFAFALPETAMAQRGAANAVVGTSPAGVTSEELTAVLQKCIELPGLQKYYPIEKGSNLKQVTVVQYPIAFAQTQSLREADKAVNFLAHPDPKSEGYFMFRTIENVQGKLLVNFNYFYKNGDAGNKIVTGFAELAKSGSTWKVSNSNLKGDL